MIDWLETHILKLIGIPVTLNVVKFALLLVQSLSDGVITDDELHSLMQLGSGVELIVLVIVMAVLKVKK